MDFQEFKLKSLDIDKEKFGRIFTFVDFGNVNYWYEKDQRDWNDNIIGANQKIIVGIEKLSDFINLFSEHKRFYYGWHYRLKASWHIVILAEKQGFIKITKPIQFVKHYLEGSELKDSRSKFIKKDDFGVYIEIPKSNFDVEISIDAIRLAEDYDTFCLFSGDSDFTALANFLKGKGKKIVIVAAGQVLHTLKDEADLYINAQRIKGQIAVVKTF